MAPLHFPQAPDASIVNRIEELTGTRLQIDWVRDEIYTDKMNTALTTNSLKKAMFLKYTDYINVKARFVSVRFGKSVLTWINSRIFGDWMPTS